MMLRLSMSHILHSRMNKTFKPSLESWKSILSISSRFEMAKLRTRAIDEITTFHPRIDPVDQIVLAVQYDISKWLSPGYAALVRRESPLECDEARKLGVDTICLIAKARERYRGALVRRESPFECNDKWANTTCKTQKDNGSALVSEHFSTSSTAAVKEHDDEVDRLVQDIFWPVPATPGSWSPPDVSDVRRFIISSSSAC